MSEVQSSAPADTSTPAPVPADQSTPQPKEEVAAPVEAGADDSSEAELEEEAEAIEDMPEDTKEEKEAKEEAKRKWKLKVAGREIEADEDELIKRAQMGYSAEQKWQEAAKIRKQVEAFIHTLQQNPAEALSQLGFNVDELAENHIRQRIEEMQKSPEQVEREKLEKELQKLKSELEAKEKAAREAEIRRIQEQYAKDVETDIMSALEQNKGLPKSPYVVKRITDAMIAAIKRGYHDVTAKDVLPYVQDEIREELRQMYSVVPDDVFEMLIGKDRLNQYRKSRVKKRPQPTNVLSEVKPTGQTELKEKENRPKQKISARDFFKKLS